MNAKIEEIRWVHRYWLADESAKPGSVSKGQLKDSADILWLCERVDRLASALTGIAAELRYHGKQTHQECWGCVLKDQATEALEELEK